jgi:hypothetical protein
MNFSLKKYYVDFVTCEGYYFIGYSARLSFGRIKINYSATLHHPSILGVNAGPALSARDAPVENDSTLTWRSSRLGFDGQWQRLAAAEKLVLHESTSGIVEWDCRQPAAQAKLATSSGTTFHGLGYVESLNLTMPPWQLGLQTLLWGRFASDSHSVVWIQWWGEHTLTVVICDGERISNAQISDNRVGCDGFELSFEPAITIREDSIGETLVSKIPSILKVAPIEFLGGREQKYLSRGQLKFCSGSHDTGWVIHERVSWGQDST